MVREEMRRELLKAACERKTVSYGYLMRLYGLTRGGSEASVVSALSELDEAEARAGAPGFAAIVVRSDTGFPGGGFFCWKGIPAAIRRPESRANDPRLSTAEKDYVKGLQERIWSFYRSKNPLSPGQAKLEI